MSVDGKSPMRIGKVSRVRHLVPGGSRESLPKREVRFADYPGVSPQLGLKVLLAETVAGSAPHPEVAGLRRDGCIRG